MNANPIQKASSMLQDFTRLVSIDEQTIAQAELNAYIESLAQEIAPEIEIDSDIDRDFGTLYRVWSGYHLLGVKPKYVLFWDTLQRIITMIVFLGS